MDKLGYLFQACRFEYLTNRASDTVIVFTHGILSNGRTAFKLQGKENQYFWDLLRNKFSFHKIDFGQYTYGVVELARLLHRDNPLNNLPALAEDLYGYTHTFRNVILIGHSQGGLLAKTYAMLYRKEQGVLLITLHSPHRERGIGVMTTGMKSQWKQAAYQIPHIFAASAADTKITRVKEALHGCKDVPYTSTISTYAGNGHSHLNTCPGADFIELIGKEIMSFLNSGHNRRPVYLPKRNINALTHDTYRMDFVVSSSRLLLQNWAIFNDREDSVISNPWAHQMFTMVFESINDFQKVYLSMGSMNTFALHCETFNYFARQVLNFPIWPNVGFRVKRVDPITRGAHVDTANYLFEKSLKETSNEENYYKDLAFDVRDFDKDELINNVDFVELFSNILLRADYSISKAYDIHMSYDKSILRGYYRKALAQYRQHFLEGMRDECLLEYEIGNERFFEVMSELIKTLLRLPEKRYAYPYLHEVFKKTFETKSRNISTREMECCMSKIFRNCEADRDYALARNVRIMFSH